MRYLILLLFVIPLVSQSATVRGQVCTAQNIIDQDEGCCKTLMLSCSQLTPGGESCCIARNTPQAQAANKCSFNNGSCGIFNSCPVDRSCPDRTTQSCCNERAWCKWNSTTSKCAGCPYTLTCNVRHNQSCCERDSDCLWNNSASTKCQSCPSTNSCSARTTQGCCERKTQCQWNSATNSCGIRCPDSYSDCYSLRSKGASCCNSKPQCIWETASNSYGGVCYGACLDKTNDPKDGCMLPKTKFGNWANGICSGSTSTCRYQCSNATRWVSAGASLCPSGRSCVVTGGNINGCSNLNGTGTVHGGVIRGCKDGTHCAYSCSNGEWVTATPLSGSCSNEDSATDNCPQKIMPISSPIFTTNPIRLCLLKPVDTNTKVYAVIGVGVGTSNWGESMTAKTYKCTSTGWQTTNEAGGILQRYFHGRTQPDWSFSISFLSYTRNSNEIGCIVGSYR